MSLTAVTDVPLQSVTVRTLPSLAAVRMKTESVYSGNKVAG